MAEVSKTCRNPPAGDRDARMKADSMCVRFRRFAILFAVISCFASASFGGQNVSVPGGAPLEPAIPMGQQLASTEPPHSTPGGIDRGLLATLAVYGLLIASSSLLGGWLPGRVRLTHLQFQQLISLVGGLLLGIGVFHLLVHSVREMGIVRVDTVAIWMMGGMAVMFFLLRAFHVHHHEPVAEPGSLAPVEQLGLPILPTETSHHHGHGNCQHDHHDDPSLKSRLSWAGLFFGLGVHTLLDGLALGAAMQSDADHGVVWLTGFGVMLGIALHKPLDSLTITTLMIQAGQSSRTRWLVNGFYACLCPLGATAFLLGVWTAGEVSRQIVGCSLAFSAGAFICIALADLLPEMEFHSHDRVRLSVALILGVAIAWGIRFLEPAHLHH